MNLELTLLLMETLLLAVTLTLLAFSVRESRQRHHLITEVDMATRALTRLEYFQCVNESILGAKHEIMACITGRRPTQDEDKHKVESLISALEKATSRGVRVRYLLPKFQDRLYIGFLFSKAGAEVRYSANSVVSSLRYMVIDGKTVVMGIPETTAGKTVTRKGHHLPSKALAEIMTAHFNSLSAHDMTLQEYAQNVMHQTGTTIETMAAEFKLEPRELQGILGVGIIQETRIPANTISAG